MTTEFLEELPPLLPIDFVQLREEIPYGKIFPKQSLLGKRFWLPDYSPFLDEEPFAKIALFWNESALLIEALVDKPFEEVFYPEFKNGDSLEIFIDTRDLKTAHFTNRFCHHFLILPKEVGEIGSREITRFRTEDQHPLSDPENISTTVDFESKRYRMQIKIGAEALHGYEPTTFDRLGFTYRLNGYKRQSQHYAVSSRMCAIEQHPNLWGSVKMGKEK